MKYRGKQYSVILSIGGKWKWSVEIDGHTKSGNAPNRPAGIKLPKPKLIRHWPPEEEATGATGALISTLPSNPF
jgi:hypothetical protein